MTALILQCCETEDLGLYIDVLTDFQYLRWPLLSGRVRLGASEEGTGSMRRVIAAASLLAAICFTPSPASARTWYVKPDSTGDVPTISVAVDSAAAEGDTVLLADGTFEGAGNRMVDCLDKALVIASASGNPEACIIDCGGVSSASQEKAAFYFRESANGTPRLEGVTITGCCGGVICDAEAAPEIVNCIFWDNWCMAYEIGYPGAAMRCAEGSHPSITDCQFLENRAMTGGGVFCNDASLTIANTSFIENGADYGGAIWGAGSLVLTNCLFQENLAWGAPMGGTPGGGLSWEGSAVLTDCVFRDNISYMGPGGAVHYGGGSNSDCLTITGCTFESNSSFEEGAAVAALNYFGGVEAPVLISSCTFVGNGVSEWGSGEGTLCLATSGGATIENTIIAFGTTGAFCPTTTYAALKCCNVYANVGGDYTGNLEGWLRVDGNISTDPLFCDTLGGDYRLETCSPCLPGNHPHGYDCGVPIGALCSGCACGGATVPTTWGAIKAMYR
jgi:hypothetical protein